MKKLLTFAGIGAFAAMLGIAAPGQAQTIHSGDTVDGYKITFPSTIGLFVDTSNADKLVLEKTAIFNSISGLVITFDKVSSGAPSSIQINTENITNHTGSDWGAFIMALINTGNTTATFTSILPGGTGFGSGVLSSDHTMVTYSGFQGAGDTSLWSGPDNLVINFADEAGSVINFKELPVGVPLPAAAWQGLVGLLGLGALRYGKTLKAKLIA